MVFRVLPQPRSRQSCVAGNLHSTMYSEDWVQCARAHAAHVVDLCWNCLQGNTSPNARAHTFLLRNCRGVKCGACILPLKWCKMVNESCRLVGFFDRLIYSFPNYHSNKFSWIYSISIFSKRKTRYSQNGGRGHWISLALFTVSESERFFFFVSSRMLFVWVVKVVFQTSEAFKCF